MTGSLYKRYLFSIILFLPFSLQAANLVDIYQDACENDPTYKAAQAEFQVTKQTVLISASRFLPQISLSGSVTRTHNDLDFDQSPQPGLGLLNRTYSNTISSYTLSASQSLFNFENWASLSNANAQVKQAGATLCAAAQDLMIRTVTAYFAVLRASEDLHFTQAERLAIQHELDQNKDRFQVGLIAKTAVYEAQSRFDNVVAREIASKNLYSNRIEELRQITGKSYSTLQGVATDIALVRPQPENIDTWVTTAERQNYSLQAARYASVAAREAIKIQFAGHLPTVQAGGEYNETHNSNIDGAGQFKSKTGSVSLSGTLPISSGGAVIASTRQARYQFQRATSLEEATHRNIIAQTRKAYLSVLSEISQIRADKQAIISSQSALDATQAAYDVGTRTMVDVLDAQSTLFDVQRITVAEQYNYLLQTLLLKQTAGTLNPQDIASINKCLQKPRRIITDKEIINTEIPSHKIPKQIAIKEAQDSKVKITSFSANHS